MGDVTLTAEATILTIICVVALIGNASLFWIVIRKEELRTLLNLFVLNLAAADMLVSFASMPITATTVTSEGWILGRTACVAFGFITIVSFISSVLSLGMIAFSRYYFVVKWQTYNSTFTFARGVLCVILVWLSSIALAFPPLIGWAQYRYNSQASPIVSYIGKLMRTTCILWLQHASLAHWRWWWHPISRYCRLQENIKDIWRR